MNAVQIIEDATLHGLILEPNGDRIKCRALSGQAKETLTRLTPAIIQHKAELLSLLGDSTAANEQLLVGRYPHAQVKALARGLRILSVTYGWPEDDLRLLTDWFTREPQAAIEFIWDQAIRWEDMGQPFYNQ
ncbi:hypothetical protein LIN78_05365 [Leeia sp. TBRC 13508]|uniref:TubC N-terminal docking domain-containing protein n=1 Tax=Leeia speluncae TaxID=2884804 RepID=A0ABS8D484_9NEIS|nr:hypothetical protein [Leeia speluncae]MCB6182976.1 hypothetical protein [Leeia speluncae]